MSVVFRAIDPSEREECLDLWCTVWPGDTRGYFRRYFYGDLEWLPYYTQVAVVDGKLVSAVHICKRTVACGDFRLTMGGIANVATLPEYRGKGYNTACLERAIAVMEADAMDFSLLGTGIHGYYARLGYDRLPIMQREGTLRPDVAPRTGNMAVRAAAGDDLPAIRAVYDAYNRTRPIAVQRTEPYWRDWIGASPAKLPDFVLVATDAAGNVRGYLRYASSQAIGPGGEKETNVRVTEFGAWEESAEVEIAGALFAAVVARFLPQGARKLKLEIALTEAVLQAAESILQEITQPVNTGEMVRLLHRTNLLRSFAMEWNDRWIAAGRPSGALTFATPYGPVRLDANGTFLRVEEMEGTTESLPQSTLFGLLFGKMTPEQATEDAALYPLLTAQFPPRGFIYWGADGF
jgi:GNAT superfamily N-acetyltransferase